MATNHVLTRLHPLRTPQTPLLVLLRRLLQLARLVMARYWLIPAGIRITTPKPKPKKGKKK